MTLTETYGWRGDRPELSKEQLILGRVTSIQGFKYTVITDAGERDAELAGKLLYGVAPDALPKVGDWVCVKDYDPTAYIIDVLPRRNELSRKNPGKATQRQVLSVNIDLAIVVQGLDRDFNLMRLDRYLVQLASCAIPCVVVLNKSDLADNVSSYRAEVDKLQRDNPVYFCSTYTGAGIEQLVDGVLEAGKTYILLGSSGVGKSSLLNSFMNRRIQEVNAISDFNSKGKHTTTRRDLFLLPNGSLVIDTPGMREFGLAIPEGDETDELFPAIAAFAPNCRYGDCTHMQEEGCAVLAAVEKGDLDGEVYESYLKLWKEQRRFGINAEDRKRMNRRSGKVSREANNYRKRFKF